MKPEAIVWTEGKTDWLHLKHAFQALSIGSHIAFKELESDWGDDQLLKQCVATARVEQSCPTIFIFDRDKDDIVAKVENESMVFKDWGNNVFSFALPVPSHREPTSGICIESYYTDKELLTTDQTGRRLFLADEFNSSSGRHRLDPKLSVGNRGKLPPAGRKMFRLLDSDVYDDHNKNVALSKADFAACVAGADGNFVEFRFDEFRRILEVIDRIIAQATPLTDLPFDGLDLFLKTIDDLETPNQLVALLEATIRVAKLAATTFAAVTVRHYEKRIAEATGADGKKVRPIRKILLDELAHPSLAVLCDLCRHCYYLIDDTAPSALFTLRATMADNPVLGDLGELLDDVEQLLPAPSRKRASGKGRSINKAQLRKPLLDFVLPELARYEDRREQIIGALTERSGARSASPAVWLKALRYLVALFNPLRLLPFRVRNVERVASDTNEFLVLLTHYRDRRIMLEEQRQAYDEVESDRLESYDLVVEGDPELVLDLYPFLIIDNHRLYYYSRTTPHGYKYTSAFGTSGQLRSTQRKFGYSVLRNSIAADPQKLFWAQATPTVSSTGVRTNIPAHGMIVGRQEQIVAIMDEIVQIPNQNGIVYGPGGVGKTALLLELSRQLLEDNAPVSFKNIMWASAKRDYYDPLLDVVEPGSPQFECLDNILTAVLEFHGMEDANTYKRDDQKWLVVECLREDKTLLVIDNFESLAASAQDEVIRFFNLEVKRALRDKPDHFKVIFTSRERVPTGLHQISLKGLDRSESRDLMQCLYEPYRRSGLPPLTNEQLDALHDATHGIPLMIKHCFGQVYEYGRPVGTVVSRLSTAPSKVVEFSFAEMFALLKKDEIQRKTLLLLELIGRPLMLRQMADILDINEADIAERVAQLVNFQCVTRSNTGTEEKYSVNDDVRVFTSRLVQEYASVATEIKCQIASLSIDKRMDYSREEFDVLVVFQGFLAKRQYLSAEDFIKKQMKERQGSFLLTLHYAKYLKEIKRLPEEAIELLENLRKRSGNDVQVLRLLMSYYTALEFPNYEQAHTYAREIEEVAPNDPRITFELAQFYVAWSTALKMKRDIDPLKDMVRIQKYKELAERAIKLLLSSPRSDHEWHHLAAQSYYDLWDSTSALRHIDKALAKLPASSYRAKSYERLRNEILWRLAKHGPSSFAGRRSKLFSV